MQYPPQQQLSSPHHQQTRTIQHKSQPYSRILAETAPRPKSQMEAMPPFQPLATPSRPQSSLSHLASAPLYQQYDSAVRHPVFFTDRLRKPPFPLPGERSSSVSPVAHGYVMEKRRTSAGAAGQTKL